ncbi:hypothetical protein H6758_00790 [Candidatus Nomurabacteria bacterium]|nr:hypothetical protein [Candidatus Nomurabacteria bacterium]
MDQVTEYILGFSTQAPFEVVSQVYVLGGWLIVFALLTKAGLMLLAAYKAILYTKDWNFVLLAIDIPALNVQTPKAVEQLFTHIFSVMEPAAIGTVYRRGFDQFRFSFEIISIEGYIQFLIRTLDTYRDVVEAAVYAQYPEAEITEVEDYTKGFPTKFPNETHNLWATDFGPRKHFAFPIRSYTEFEHSISKDTVLKDPMGTFLESFSRIGPGEQMWHQIIIEPLQESEWKEDCIKEIKKMIGEKSPSSGGAGGKILSELADAPMKFLETAGDQIFGRESSTGGGDAKKDDGGPPNNLLYMTPGQKKVLEAMEDKISKIGFKTKIRSMYIARKEVYNPSRGVNSLVGAMNQFNNPYSNMILPNYLTSTRYFFAEQRKEHRRNVLMNAYVNRDMYAGSTPYVLNIEELATLWHFPMSHVKTPLLQKSETKRAEPPPGLPMEVIGGGPAFDLPTQDDTEESDEDIFAPQKDYKIDGGQEYGEDMKFG